MEEIEGQIIILYIQRRTAEEEREREREASETSHRHSQPIYVPQPNFSH
jgi:hypothetical protein